MSTTREAVWRSVCAAAAAATLATTTHAQHLRLLGDLNPAPSTLVFLPSGPTLGEGSEAIAYFALGDLANGTEVWRTDGTPAGTRPLGDIIAFRPNIFGLAGDTVVFEENTALLASSGTPGQFEMLLPVGVSVPNRNSIDFWLPHARLGQRLFIQARPLNSPYEQLLVTDGTPGGTTALYTTSSPFSNSITSIGATPTRVFATVDSSASSPRALILTDGTSPATVVRTFIADNQGSGVRFGWLTPVGESAYFLAPDSQSRRQLWISDGTAPGTVQLSAFTLSTTIAALAWNGVQGAGSRLAFLGPQSAAGGGPANWLWITDGTPSGTARAQITTQVYDDFTFPTTPDTPHSPLVSINSGFAFTVLSGAAPPHGVRFGDGSIAGTSALSTGAADPVEFIAVSRGAPGAGQDVAYFIALDGGRPRVWRTDGTQAGTLVLPAPPPLGEPFAIRPLALLGTRLVYGVQSINNQQWSIWITDGTPDGTHQIAGAGVTPGGTASSSPNTLTPYGAQVVLHAASAATGTERYRTLAAAGSAALCEEAIPGPGNAGSPQFAVAGGRLFEWLWRLIPAEGGGMVEAAAIAATSDSGALGEIVVQTTNSSGITSLGTFGPGILFGGPDDPPSSLSTLWKSDGTGAGTSPVVPPGPSRPIDPSSIFEWNGRAYFIARATSVPRMALWSTDGTPGGTTELAAFDGSLTPVPGFRPLPDRLYFIAYDAGGFSRVWVTDGTPQGTRMIDPAISTGGGAFGSALLNGALIVAGFSSADEADLWTPAPADASLVPVASVRTGAAGANLLTTAPSALGDRVYFVASDGTHGNELWMTDGTPVGTNMVADIWPGPLPSDPSNLVAVPGGLVFAATSGPTGRELWFTDGTPAGTRLLFDINPGVGSSTPVTPLYRDGVIYLSAYRPDVGREPFALVLADCAADFSGDDRLNSQDFFDFLAAFFAGDPRADFNGDTVINSQDFFDYLTAFLAGCP